MSWWAYVMPLHRYPVADLAGQEVHGLPETPPEPAPLPTVAEVLSTLTAAGCYGDPWFRVDGVDDPLSERRPTGAEDLYLGEVSLHLDRPRDDVDAPLHADDRVELLALRKPGAGLRAAAIALAAGAPQIVFDDNFTNFVVVNTGDRAEDLASVWPW